MKSKNAARISKRVVDGIEPGQCIYDTEVSGFGVRCTPNGHISYILRYRTAGGRRQRYVTIGRHGSPWAPDTARTEAKRLIGAVAAGQDPAQEKEIRRATLTVDELADRYLDDHARLKKKARSAEGDETNLRLHIRPNLGDLLITDVTRADIVRFHMAMKATPGAANRCLALLSKMFSLAEQWGLSSDGSRLVRGVQRFPERARHRYLTEEESQALAAALEVEKANPKASPYFLALIRLLWLTGARLSEIQTMRWADFDPIGRKIVLPDSKTGAKSILLSGDAVAIIQSLPRIEGNPYVLAGDRPGKHLVGVQKAWQRLRKRAGIEDVRIHDLRHTFASVMAVNGHSLLAIGAVLGHKHTATTARYAHLTNAPVHAAATEAAAQIAARFAAE